MKEKTRPNFDLEQKISGIVCGIDEVGRGPLAGPVTASAVILPFDTPTVILKDINDSKKVSAKRRAELYDALHDYAEIGIGQASVDEIDEINILQATFLAMQRAVAALGGSPVLALVDGNRAPKLDIATQTVIKGDQKSLSIAAASIIAKHHRDCLMTELAQEYPHYAWESNAGYGTRAHMEGLRAYGVTPHHRKSFRPISELIDASN